jgi:phosphatidylserine synthase
LAGIGLTSLVVVLSLLMVSHVKYDTMPKLSKRQVKAHPWKIVGLLIGLLIVVFSKGDFLFLMITLYIIFGLVRAAFLKLKKIITKTENEPDEVGEFSSIDI